MSAFVFDSIRFRDFGNLMIMIISLSRLFFLYDDKQSVFCVFEISDLFFFGERVLVFLSSMFLFPSV